MNARAFCWLALGAGLCAAPCLQAQDRPPQIVTGPAKNWVWPRFTREGYRWMTLRGTEVREVSASQIDIVDMNITVYSKDAAARIDSIVLSPSASYFTREDRASGPKSVRLIDYQHNLEVTGEQWTVDLDTKKISIARNVRVVIHAPLAEILK